MSLFDVKALLKTCITDFDNWPLQAIWSYCCPECSAITTIVLSKQIEIIDQGAFSNTGVKSIDLSHCEKLPVLGKNAFNECVHLQQIYLP
jgi:hypothetical protein